jgi:L-cysteine desulfidase
MENQTTEYFWNTIVQKVSTAFASLRAVFNKETVVLHNLENNLLQQLKAHFDKEIPVVQIHAVEALVKLDIEVVDVQRRVLYTLYGEHKNFEHLEKAFDQYQSIYSVYVEEMLPHQKTALIKYCVAAYADLGIDRITYNL